MNKQVLNKITDIIEKTKKEESKKPFQYVVGYYRVDNEKLIGYHLSTFCQITQEIFEAKRYNGENPTEQLKVIANNIKSILNNEYPDSILKEINESTRNAFDNLKAEEVYIDAIYITEDFPKQNFKYQIVSNVKEPDINIDINIDKNLN